MQIDKRMIIIGASAAVVLIIGIYAVISFPMIESLRKTALECKSLEKNVREAREVIERAGKVYGKRILISENDISLAIDELTKHGKSMRINFISIKPQELVSDSKSKYKILPIDMEIEATDQKFADFLGSLDSLEKGVIRVKSFDVFPNKDDKARLNAKLTIDMYLAGQ